MLSFANSSTLSTTLKVIRFGQGPSRQLLPLDLFVDDAVTTPRLQIEDFAGEVLELIPHTSSDMRTLLRLRVLVLKSEIF